jgi:hypothetical protein
MNQDYKQTLWILQQLPVLVSGLAPRAVRRILKDCGRADDYIDVSLDGDIRYNPLNSDADAYAQAFNIASVIVAIWGKGKEPFWCVSRT